MMRVKRNDTVVVLAGKDKGKRGVVLAINTKKGKVMVKGIALATHHVKARRAGETSGIRKEEAFFDLSNVMPVCLSCDKPCRVNFVQDSAEKDNAQISKRRVCNRCKSAL